MFLRRCCVVDLINISEAAYVTTNIFLKRIFQRILRGVNTMLKLSVLVKWRPGGFFWILKGHYHKRTINHFGGFMICEMVLPNRIDFPAFPVDDLFRNTRQSAVTFVM